MSHSWDTTEPGNQTPIQACEGQGRLGPGTHRVEGFCPGLLGAGHARAWALRGLLLPWSPHPLLHGRERGPSGPGTSDSRLPPCTDPPWEKMADCHEATQKLITQHLPPALSGIVPDASKK